MIEHQPRNHPRATRPPQSRRQASRDVDHSFPARGLSASALLLALSAAAGGCGAVDAREDFARFGEVTGGLVGLRADLPAGPDAVAPADVVEAFAGTGNAPAPGGETASPSASPKPRGWTEENAVRAAMLLHPSVRAALARVGASKADLVQAGLLPNPSVSGNVVFASAAPTLFSFDAMQTLLLLGQIPLRQAAARAALERTILSAADGVLGDLAAVRRTFHELAYAERLLELLRRTEEIYGRALKTTQDRREAGTATAIDVNLAESQVLGVQAEIAAAEGRRDALRAELAARMGLPAWSDGWSLSVPAEDAAAGAAARMPTPTVETAVEAALKHRPDLRLADARIREAEAELSQARLLPYPVPQAGVNTDRQPPTYVGPAFSLEVPLFDQGLPRIARAEFALSEARRDRETAELLARREAAAAAATLAADARQVTLLRERAVPLTERNLALAEQAFRGGQAGLLTVLAAQQAFLEARRRLLSAVRDYRIHAADLDRATGKWLTVPAGR